MLKGAARGGHRDGCVAGRCAGVWVAVHHRSAPSARYAGQYDENDGSGEPGMTALSLPNGFQNQKTQEET